MIPHFSSIEQSTVLAFAIQALTHTERLLFTTVRLSYSLKMQVRPLFVLLIGAPAVWADCSIPACLGTIGGAAGGAASACVAAGPLAVIVCPLAVIGSVIVTGGVCGSCAFASECDAQDWKARDRACVSHVTLLEGSTRCS